MPHNLILILFWQGHCEFRWTCSRESGVLTKLFFLFFSQFFLFFILFGYVTKFPKFTYREKPNFYTIFWGNMFGRNPNGKGFQWKTWPTVCPEQIPAQLFAVEICCMSNLVRGKHTDKKNVEFFYFFKYKVILLLEISQRIS